MNLSLLSQSVSCNRVVEIVTTSNTNHHHSIASGRKDPCSSGIDSHEKQKKGDLSELLGNGACSIQNDFDAIVTENNSAQTVADRKWSPISPIKSVKSSVPSLTKPSKFKNDVPELMNREPSKETADSNKAKKKRREDLSEGEISSESSCQHSHSVGDKSNISVRSTEKSANANQLDGYRLGSKLTSSDAGNKRLETDNNGTGVNNRAAGNSTKNGKVGISQSTIKMQKIHSLYEFAVTSYTTVTAYY